MTLAPAEELHLESVSVPAWGPATLQTEHSVVVGRAENCGICLPDPSVSREHARLVFRDGQWFLTDLHSRHGTSVNGVHLVPDHPAIIGAGDLLRFGPCVLRLTSSADPIGTLAPMDEAALTGTIVERVPDRGSNDLAHRRLELMIDGAAALHQAGNEAELASALLDLVLSGTGFPRAAILRRTTAQGVVEMLSHRDLRPATADAFRFSRSLLAEVDGGHVARLTDTTAQDYGQSIIQLGITSAVCAPIMLEESVVGYIYLDARGTESPGYGDAPDFCQAVSRLASLALANLKARELQSRQHRLDEDLHAARLAQSLLAPEESGQIGALVFADCTEPGHVIAGDLFDIFAIDDARTVVCCGDVSGHGLAAAILMTAALSHLRAIIPRLADTAGAMREVNRYISERSPDNMFITLWIGIYDANRQELQYVDAGHGHWILKRPGEAPRRATVPNGLLAGIDEAFPYTSDIIPLKPGDRLILYSDGVTEAMNQSGEQFGAQRLCDLLTDADSPQQDVQNVMAAVREYIDGRPLDDDTTIASLLVCAPETGSAVSG